MPDRPRLDVPPLGKLGERFRRALEDPANGILRRDERGNPVFGAYIGSDSNECITWSVIALGEWLSGRDATWLLGTFGTYFSPRCGAYMNSPCSAETELWYLNYTNALAGAVTRALFGGDEDAAEKIGRSADALCRMARTLDYDFNVQGFSFDAMAPFTRRDAYRQPDSSGGYAYNMLFAALHGRRPQYMEECLRGMRAYLGNGKNPWYEIPNGSSALLAAAWLDAHGERTDVRRAASWVYDHETGPLQTGTWGGEEIDGLMMGWRGETREAAMASAYSMESLMPLQFVLPAVRYCPALADAAGKYARCLLSNFQLFRGRGTRPLYQTRPDLDDAVPYEKLARERDGHSPAACGDFHGHRSVYGSGYLTWLDALARPAADGRLFALDLSVTDWLARERTPVFLVRNPYGEPLRAEFTPARVWEGLRPGLYRDGKLDADALDRETGAVLPARGAVSAAVPAGGMKMIALLPKGERSADRDGIACLGGSELWKTPDER